MPKKHLTYIPYRAETDPKQYLASVLQQAFGGLERREQEKRRTGDIRDITKYAQYRGQLSGAEKLQQALMGMTPEARQQYQGPTPQWPAHQAFPQLQSPELQQLAAEFQLQNLFQTPLEQARLENLKARTEEIGKPKPTKIQALINEGYTRKEAKEIRDVFHGLKPRASVSKKWTNLPLPEQLSKWQTIYNKTLDPEWGAMRPIGDMDAVRELAQQNISSITSAVRTKTLPSATIEPSRQLQTKQTKRDFVNKVSQIAKMKVGGKIVGSKQARQIVRQYPEVSRRMGDLGDVEIGLILKLIDAGKTEEQILSLFTKAGR